MTQSRRGVTALHLTPAAISLVTGAFLAPAAQILAVVNDLTGTHGALDASADTLARVRDELIRQVPWLSEITVPDFNAPGSTATKAGFVAEIADRFGGTVEIEVGTLALPEVPPSATVVRNP